MGWHFGQNIGRAWKKITGQYDPGASVPNAQQWEADKQHENEKLLQQWATTGNGPSVAQQLLDRNRGINTATQLGAAKTLGGDPALANRNAAEAIAQGNSDATYQAGLIRSQEQGQAMQNYINSLSGSRGQAMDYQNAMYGIGQGNANRMGQFVGNMMKAAGGAAGGGAAGGGAAGGV